MDLAFDDASDGNDDDGFGSEGEEEGDAAHFDPLRPLKKHRQMQMLARYRRIH